MGCARALPHPLSASRGPAKRDVELQRAIDLSCGHVVCESRGEIRRLQNLADAANARVPVLLRINPAQRAK